MTRTQDEHTVLKLGEFNKLKAIAWHQSGLLLDDGQGGEILLKGDEEHAVGDTVDAFIYLESSGDMAATTHAPLAAVGQIAWMRVVTVNEYGAFADWGLPRDLFIPFAEQKYTLNPQDHALVRVYLDNQNRIAGSTKLDRWIKDAAPHLKKGEQVSLIIADRTELGFKAVINQEFWGLLYKNELSETPRKGQCLDGYIKQVREDGRIDLSLVKPGYSRSKIDLVAEAILARLAEHDGQLMLTDKSSPEAIHAVFGVSKKVFKQAVGALYKQRRIQLDDSCIRLVK
jgi:predicted RNA-binding protein (virulence factor B family)